MDLYAVVGNPISHSKSPRIHSLFAEQTGEALEYTAVQAPEDGFDDTVKSFFARGGKGLNITVPFKEQAWQISDRRSQWAELAGAVNTFSYRQGVLFGDNTDGIGLVTDLINNNQITLTGKRILVIGAGGAVRGVLLPLLQQQPEAITLVNRTREKAETLARIFSEYGSVQVRDFPELTSDFDLIINGTSASLKGDLPPLSPDVVTDDSIVYDMMYAPQETAFNSWARQQGTGTCIDGLGMLVEQAAEAFEIWRDVRPETKPVLEKLRDDY